jgi:hypothetical protein
MGWRAVYFPQAAWFRPPVQIAWEGLTKENILALQGISRRRLENIAY